MLKRRLTVGLDVQAKAQALEQDLRTIMPDNPRSLPQFTPLYYHSNPNHELSGIIVHSENETYLMTSTGWFVYIPTFSAFLSVVALHQFSSIKLEDLTSPLSPSV